MENCIDKVDVKRDHKELIALFYRIELMTFIQILLYNNRDVLLKPQPESGHINLHAV